VSIRISQVDQANAKLNREFSEDQEMKVSASIELIWNLAAREAVAAEHKEIEPEHFLSAVLKFSELPVEEMDKVGAGAEATKQLAMEVNAVRQELVDRAIKSALVRQQIRVRLGKGSQPYESGVIHRSATSRDLFDAAARLAAERGDEALSAQHLLETMLISPSSVMARVLGDVAGPSAPRHTPTPLLTKYGRDLTDMTQKVRLPPGKRRSAESKVLIQSLARGQRPIVLLITDEEEAAHLVVMEVANAIVAHETGSGMRRKQVVDLTDVNPYEENTAETLALLGDLLAQAAKVPEVILFVPAIEAPPYSLKDNEWAHLLKDTLARVELRCISRVAPTVYCELIEKDPVWRRLAEAIWIHQITQEEVPWEL